MTGKPLNPDVARHLEEIASCIGREARDDFKQNFDCLDLDQTTESPIEQMMAVGLLYALTSHKHYGENVGGTFSSPARGVEPATKEGFRIRPQTEIGEYRADFFVTYKHYTGATVGAVIECDGHDFHEKTKEQARHDKVRDRYFQSLGFLVLRYAGSEVFRDPIKCATDALSIIFTRADSAIKDEK